MTSSEKLQSEVSQRNAALPEHWVAALFTKFQVRYGHKWTSAMQGLEDAAVEEWSTGLGGFTGEQIARGLSEWQGDWPPSLPEFKNACIGKIDESGGDPYYCPTFNGPTLPRITDRSRLLSSDERERSRSAARSLLAETRKKLTGVGY